MSQLLEARNLTKDFGGLVAVRNVSFSVAASDIVGLIGPNGAGKTTVFNLITGMEKIESGEVYFEGANISKLKPHSICKLGHLPDLSERPSFPESHSERECQGWCHLRKDHGSPECPR